jgi:hypothetical protein
MLGHVGSGNVRAMGQHFPTVLSSLAVGWLMVVAGLGKRQLVLRPKACPTCGRRLCRCASRR